MRIALLTVFAGTSIVFAQAEISPNLAKATRALEDGVPEVAATELQTLLKQDLAKQDRRVVVEKLAQAFVRSHQPDDALKLLDSAGLTDDAEAEFWRAQALATVARPAEALPIYQKLAQPNSAKAPEARFGAAEMLRLLNRRDEAIQEFSLLFRDPRLSVRAQLRAIDLYLDKSDTSNAARLLNKLHPANPADRRERHFLRGRLELTSGWPEKAIGTFESILRRSKGADHAIAMAALFGIADAHLHSRTPDKGDDVLEDFIEHHPEDPDIDRIFAKLDELYRAESRPSRVEFERWIHDPAEPRRGLARWYLARLEMRAGHNERATELFRALLQSNPLSPQLAPALLDFARLLMRDRKFDQAFRILEQAGTLQPRPEVLGQIKFLAAQTQYLRSQFEPAANSFAQVASSSPNLAEAATFNAALGWLQLAARDPQSAEYRELAQKTDVAASPELQLDAALLAASHGDKHAADDLQNFVRQFPQHERVSEARVALAELAFHSSPPRLEEARTYLSSISNPAPAAEERRDYLLIWLEDARGGTAAKVIELAKNFLQRHPHSKSAEDVRWKLAEVYYREHDFSNAQTEFQLLAEQNPNGESTEKALYFAAESAASSMGAHSIEQALTLFDRVVHLNGQLKWAARNEQAAIERKLGKNSDAIVLYDEVLKGDARAAEKREALCAKADIFFEMGELDPKSYTRARELYDQLAADREGTTHWRKQALFKKGLCLEKESNRPAALATFYDVLQESGDPKGSGELFWFYKAGFSAARVLEEMAKWDSAAAIYEKLAAIGGSRSEEARQRLDHIRLEHFLWQE